MISGNSRISESDCVLLSVFVYFFPCVLQLLLAPVKFECFFLSSIHHVICMVYCNFLTVCLSQTFSFLFWKMSKSLLYSPLLPSCFLDTVRKSISEASISSRHADPPVPSESSEFPTRKLSVKSQTCQDLGSHNSTSHSAPLLSERTVCHA